MPEGIEGLPNVEGLTEFVADDQTSDKGTPAPQTEQTQHEEQPQANQTPQATAGPEELNLEQFKNPKDILKSYKEIQGFTTRVAQENKQLKEQLASIQENMELMRLQQPPPVAQQRPQAQQKDFDSLFIENPQQAVAAVASKAVQQQMHKAMLAQVLDEEYGKNPNDYDDRFAYANRISQQYPQLLASPVGVRKLFQMADKYRVADYQQKGMAYVRALAGGQDVDYDKFISLIKKDQTGQPAAQTNQINNAYMPDNSTSSNRSGPESGKQTSHEAEIQSAVKKGDPDAVIASLFKERGLR